MDNLLLYQDLLKEVSEEDFFVEKVPSYIPANLASKFELRPYQKEAFGRFIYYFSEYDGKPKDQAVQNLFHMATGSGKTLIMAGLMLYLYEQGYRNFLFFVNSSNIIDKTRENFLNPASAKYLFMEDKQIGEKRVRVREVTNFSSAHPDDINIIFTTIQGLHSTLNTPRENAITYEDFKDQKVVLFSDEAHHINAETKKGYKLTVAEEENIASWEQTVFRLFKAHDENILLEFTATLDLGNPAIRDKYRDKIIMDYPLKEFRKDGYSKEVKVLQADSEKFERALQAIILSQYRRKIFTKHRLLIKPVILFKSRTIKDSEAFYELFNSKMKNLGVRGLEEIKGNPSLDPVLEKAFAFFKKQEITLENLAQELRDEFSEDKCLTINSKSESEEKQIAVNTLEDFDNEYRAVFAVDKLNEGWDVLNLFDIVRLYNTKAAKNGKPGKTTMSEAQLIGRGARYCPFRLNENQSLYKRKYDFVADDEKREMKICEEIFYHSVHNHGYISELSTALEEVGIKAQAGESKRSKSSVKQAAKREKRKKVRGFSDHLFKVELRTGYMASSSVFEGANGKPLQMAKKQFRISSLGDQIIKKALNRLPFYYFSNLSKYFLRLRSHTEFIYAQDYLGEIKVEVSAAEGRLESLKPVDRLDIIVQVLDELSSKIKSGKVG